MEKYPEMVTIKEAAQRTGMTYNAVEQLCIKNKIVFVQIGRKRLINWQKLCDFLNGEEEKPAGNAAQQLADRIWEMMQAENQFPIRKGGKYE